MALFYISAHLFNAWLSALSAGSSYLALWSTCCDMWFWLMSMEKTSGFTYIRRRKKEDLGDPGRLLWILWGLWPILWELLYQGEGTAWPEARRQTTACSVWGMNYTQLRVTRASWERPQMVGMAPEVGVREGPDTWWPMLHPAAMEGRPCRVLPGRGPEPLALGKRTPAAWVEGWGRACGVGRAGGGKPRSSCNGPGNGWLPFGRFWEDLSLSYVRVQSCCSRWWPWASETRLITLNRLF